MNGHGAPTLVEHVGDDIVVWPAPDEDAWASNGSSAASAVPLTTESADDDEADEWLGVGAAVAIRQPALHSRRGEATAALGDRLGHRGPRGRSPPVGRVGTDAAGRDEGPAHVSQPRAIARSRWRRTHSCSRPMRSLAESSTHSISAKSPAAFAASYNGTGLSDDLSASRSPRPRARTRFAAQTRWRTSISRTGPTSTNISRTPSSKDCRSVRRRSRVRSTSSLDSWARKRLRSRAPTPRSPGDWPRLNDELSNWTR